MKRAFSYSVTDLPVHEILPELKSALAGHRCVVLEAPPGAGKTTGIPPALIDEAWLKNQKILMLEPRRLAAIQAAHRIAASFDEEVGDRAGYRIRFENRAGPRTRIEIVTEGVLTRKLQSDPGLAGVGLLIFDEFHERSLQADLGLALALECADLREDLRILVMSATIEGDRVARLLDGPSAGQTPVVRSTGRQYPVTVRYADEARLFAFAGVSSSADFLARRTDRTILNESFFRTIVAGVHIACEQQKGDVLVFLPGGGEIRRAAEQMKATNPTDLVLPLFGDLSRKDQDRAIRPDPDGRRRIILSTNIAQTSLTIEGIGAVVDGGFARTSRYDPSTGMSGLELVRIAKDAATQRSGRAGRLGPGLCLRLWSRAEETAMMERTPPEILETDLAPFLLDALSWGTTPDRLRLLDAPPAAALRRARQLLAELGAITDKDGNLRVTPAGRAMNALPVHPRLARLVLAAGSEDRTARTRAARIAALVSERDIMRPGSPLYSVDLELRLEILQAFADEGRPGAGNYNADPEACRRVLQTADALKRFDPPTDNANSTIKPAPSTGGLLACAFPDRIGRLREKDDRRYLLSSGRGAHLEPGDPFEGTFIVAPVLDGIGADAKIRLAARIDEAELREIAADRIKTEKLVRFDEKGGFAVCEEERLDSLTLRRRSLPDEAADSFAIEKALLDRFLDEWNDATLPESSRHLVFRVNMLRRLGENLPDLTDETLCETADEWLLPFLSGTRKPSDISGPLLEKAILHRLSHSDRARLDELAPERITVPSGSSIPIDYSRDEPVLAVKLQEMFGLADTPRIAGGRLPLTLHLLSPAGRPVQVTKDLRNFWNTTYADVRRELRGRYPKHPWPEDPWTAQPTRKTKPRNG